MNLSQFFEDLKVGDVSAVEHVLTLNPDFVNAKDDSGWPALHRAISTGRRALVKLLIAHGADVNLPNDEGETAIFFVLDHIPEHSGIIVLLLESGADIEAKNVYGHTPLHEAAWYAEEEPAQFLIDHGADIQSTDHNGATPLHLAAQSGLADMVNLLLDNGAQVNSVTLAGCTALHFAIDTNIMRHKLQFHLAAIETLLQRGANPLAQTRDLRTPLDVARTQTGYPEIAALLIRYGAK